MTADKTLFFIPIIARALQSDDPRRAMEEAFEKIRELGKEDEYQEGYQQFAEFIKTALRPSDGTTSGQKVRLLKDAIHRLLHDLATDTFEGDDDRKEALIAALREIPELNAKYVQIKGEAQGLFLSKVQMNVEVLKENQLIGSFPISPDPAIIGAIAPGRYRVQFSNGRILWEGELLKEDLIWAYAFPGKDLAMAAETEASERKPTRKISLIEGEITIFVFAGIETGYIRIEIAKGI
jgi:hypothetical protein